MSKSVHLAHCYQGDYFGLCKYNEPDCPAKPKEAPPAPPARDIEIAALAALVSFEAACINADMARYGQLTSAPDFRAPRALDKLLEVRGVYGPPPEPEATE